MKILNTLQELWEYCQFCHICQDYTKNINATPSSVKLISNSLKQASFSFSFKKGPSELEFVDDFEIEENNIYSGNVLIDCHNNTFTSDLSNFIDFIKPNVKRFYSISLYGDCFICNSTHINASITLDFSQYIVNEMRIYNESIHLLSEPDKFHVTIDSANNKMHISKYMFINNLTSPGRTAIVDTSKIIILPLVDLDFTNIPKVVSRIKTMITFS